MMAHACQVYHMGHSGYHLKKLRGMTVSVANDSLEGLYRSQVMSAGIGADK